MFLELAEQERALELIGFGSSLNLVTGVVLGHIRLTCWSSLAPRPARPVTCMCQCWASSGQTTIWAGTQPCLSADRLSKDQRAHSCLWTRPCPPKGQDPPVGRHWPPSSTEPTHASRPALPTRGLAPGARNLQPCNASQTLLWDQPAPGRPAHKQANATFWTSETNLCQEHTPCLPPYLHPPHQQRSEMRPGIPGSCSQPQGASCPPAGQHQTWGL